MPYPDHPMPDPDLPRLFEAAGIDPRRAMFAEKDLLAFARYLQLFRHDPYQLAVELVRRHHAIRQRENACEKAAEAATELEQMLQDLLEGNATLCHVERVYETPAGPRAVCRFGTTLREISIHRDVDVQRLRQLKAWEYAKVHQDIVVGFWAHEKTLFVDALGPVVEFKGYQDREAHTVRVMDGPQERIARLDPSLTGVALTPGQKLVLHRSESSLVIDTVPLENVQSRFEVPIDKMHTRLDDLAGVDDIAQRLLEDMLLRVCCREVGERYGLEPLKGILLYSYKPGMGKTALMRAIALWLHEHSDQFGFDVILYSVKPNETKSMWHGEDARIVREDLFGAIRARQALARKRPLVVLVVLDEIDSLGKRAGRGQAAFSSAQSESLEALLVELDGLIQDQPGDGPPSYVLCCGLTNRPDRVDEAAKRPGRLSLVVPMPDVTQESAEEIMALYARGKDLPWYIGERVQPGLSDDVIRSHFVRPALASVFGEVVLRYATDTQKVHEVTAGQILSNAHFTAAMNRAKKRAAVRELRGEGIPAVTYDDVVGCLLDVSCETARQMAADPQMLIRQLDIKVPVARVEVVPREELEDHRYVRLHNA